MGNASDIVSQVPKTQLERGGFTGPTNEKYCYPILFFGNNRQNAKEVREFFEGYSEQIFTNIKDLLYKTTVVTYEAQRCKMSFRVHFLLLYIFFQKL